MNYSFINYHSVSAPAGSGKTHAAVRYAVDRARLGEKVIIAQPNKRCIAEWFAHTRTYAEGLSAASVPVTRFDGDVCAAGHIVQEIVEHMEGTGAGGEVMFLTHASLKLIADHGRAADWHLIVDEIPAPDAFFAKHLPNNHWFLTEAIQWQDYSADCVRLMATDEERLRQFALNKARDDIDAEFQDIAGCLLSNYYDVFAIRENLQRTLDGETERGKYPLYLFALLRPTIFRAFQSAVIMGACFEESLLALLWGSQGVDFRPHAKLTAKLRFTEHANGERLEIRYLTDDAWSKRLANKGKIFDGREVTNNEIALEAVKEVFGDAPFLYLVNKDVEEVARAWFLGLNAEALPHAPHGLNGFAHHHNLAAIASFLPPPFHHRFLGTQNLTAEAIRDAVHHQAVYQAVCRCSLRDPKSTKPVKVLLTDRHVAEWLADQFPGCRLAPVGNAPLIRRGQAGRKPKHADAKARVQDYRQRQRDLAEEVMLAQMLPDIQDGSIWLKRNPKYYYSDFVTGKDDHLRGLGPGEKWFADLSFLREELWVGTLFEGRKDIRTSCQATVASHDQVITWLRHLHGLTYADKHDNWLISPALFNPTLGEHWRGKENVVLAWGIWLDVDGGDLPYAQLQRMFPGIRMIIYSTWSSTDLTRYRVVLPTEGYMLGDTYGAVCRQIIHVIQSNGYCSPRQKKRGSAKPCHGIDLGKTYAANMMYLPCQPGPGGLAFFEVFDGDALDPALWLEHNVVPIPGPSRKQLSPDILLPPSQPGTANAGPAAPARKLVQTAAARIVSDGPGHRNNNLYYAARICFALANVGLLDAFEVEATLSSAARLAGLEASDVKATIASARKHAWEKQEFAEEMRSRTAGLAEGGEK